jgi:hypothetical protein
MVAQPPRNPKKWQYRPQNGLGTVLTFPAAAGGWTLDIVNITPAVRRIFEVSGLTVLLSESDRVGLPGMLAL